MRLTAIIKPTHLCNFSCKYCYNEDKRSPIMNSKTLQKMIKEFFAYIKATEGPSIIDFIWHGGEPLISGIDFYEEVVELQHSYGQNVCYKNNIQTNGTLLDRKWIVFLEANKFKVSVSLDGPENIHNRTRVFSNGKGTFRQVMKSIDLLRQSDLKFGVIAVISKSNKNDIDEVYNFFAKEKLNFQIVPLTKLGNAISNFEDLGLNPKEYADPWMKMYDKWFYAKENRYIFCKDFVNKSVTLLNGICIDCASTEQCAQDNISIDPEGFVYPCGTFSAKKEWRYGNINDDVLSDIMNTGIAVQARNRKKDDYCKKCEWEKVCHGGCYSRAANFFGTINRRDYYCPSLKRIYKHINTKLREKLALQTGLV